LGFTPGTAYSLPTATTTVLGGVKIDGTSVTINGSGVISASTSYSLPTASTTVLGGVKIDGSTITISGSGVINANYTTYSLPTASSSVLGGVKVGTGLTIDGAGILGASGPTYAAITTLVVTTPVFNYNIDQYSGDNPAIYAISGTTIAFNLQVGGSHPFLIQTNTGSWANITTANLIHVSTSGVVSTGSAAQGQTSGTLYWKIPISVSGTFRYICQNHSSMVGSITVSPKNNIGYLNIPQNSQSAAYVLTLADAGKHIFHPADDVFARTYTIPANSSVAYPIGTALAFINMTLQVVTIAIDTDTLYLSGTGTTGSRTLAQYGSASAIKITATSWLIAGSGLS